MMASPLSQTADNSRELNDQERTSLLAKSLHQSWKAGRYCDVTLRVGKLNIRTHKLVLLSLTDYFKHLLDMDVDGKQDTVELHVDFACLCQLLEYAYTGVISMSGENVQDLLIASDYLQVEFVRKSCETFMIDNMDSFNCLSLLVLAGNYSLRKLTDKALDVINFDFETISKTPEFVHLPIDVMLEVYQDKHLVMYDHNVPLPTHVSELVLLQSVLRCINESRDCQSNAVKLIKSIRLPLIDVKRLDPEIKGCSKIMEIQEVSEILEVLHKIEQKKKLKKLQTLPKEWFTPRSPRGQTFQLSQRGFSTGNEVGRPKYFHDADKISTHTRLLHVKVALRRWDERLIVGGIALTYTDGTRKAYGLSAKHERCVEVCRFSLKETEVITSISVRCGYMIDSLKFSSNFGNTFGPFGGDGGSKLVTRPPMAGGYLHSVAVGEVKTQGCKGITHLWFNWIVFDNGKGTTKRMENFMKNKKKRDAFSN